MLAWALIVVISLHGLTCQQLTGNETTEEPAGEEIPERVTLPVATGNIDVRPSEAPKYPRRRGRRPRGFFNDMRYRDPYNIPYNPNGPYSYRGRAGQPPMAYRQQQEYNPYYDPYNQYYQAYGHQQQYQYPYPQQVRVPPTPPPPTETIPDLYYVQKADSPGGHYQYKRVSVVQDFPDSRLRRRPTRGPQNPVPAYGHPVPPYYNYPYDPYNRNPPPPPPQQQYYQSYPYPHQYPAYYNYPQAPYRPRRRGVKTFPRSTMSPSELTLTIAPAAPLSPGAEPRSSTKPSTEPSGD